MGRGTGVRGQGGRIRFSAQDSQISNSTLQLQLHSPTPHSNSTLQLQLKHPNTGHRIALGSSLLKADADGYVDAGKTLEAEPIVFPVPLRLTLSIRSPMRQLRLPCAIRHA